jgi:3''5''-cyclic nucleotide phosphodiesterase.
MLSILFEDQLNDIYPCYRRMKMDDETSRNSSSQQQEETAAEDMWTGLNELDVNDALSPPPMNELIQRAIRIFEKHLKQVISTRQAKIREITSSHGSNSTSTNVISDHIIDQSMGDLQDSVSVHTKPIKQVEVAILNSSVRQELQDLVSTISSKYNNVLYHNFEHATHVMASADCLLSMLQNTTLKTNQCDRSNPIAYPIVAEPNNHKEKKLSTYGIATCPITHLALVYSALVHDVEHEGVGNQQMVKEKHPLAIKYKGKSVAENNSLDIAIDLLQQKNYANLRRAIFGDFNNSSSEVREFMKAEERIFYNILIENIQATDVFSRERLDRNRRKWIESFDKMKHDKSHRGVCTCEDKSSKIVSRRASVPPASKPTPITTLSRLRSPSIYGENCSVLCPSCQMYHDLCVLQLDHMRACAVLVQMIQAADVAHSMQSWPIFLKWNMKLYNEFWAAKIEWERAKLFRKLVQRPTCIF